MPADTIDTIDLSDPLARFMAAKGIQRGLEGRPMTQAERVETAWKIVSLLPPTGRGRPAPYIDPILLRHEVAAMARVSTDVVEAMTRTRAALLAKGLDPARYGWRGAREASGVKVRK